MSGGGRIGLVSALTASVVAVAGCGFQVAQSSGTVETAAGAGSPLANWRPQVPLQKASMSDAERDQLNGERLAWLASHLHISDPPVETPVRWIYPEEIGTVIVSCLNEAGFEVSSSSDGRGFTADAGSESQVTQFNLAWYRCSARYPTDPRTQPSVWNAQQRAAAHEYISEALIPCLQSIGANPAPAPSLEVFLADPGSWQYPDPGNGKTMALWEARCPASPPSRVIIGES